MLKAQLPSGIAPKTCSTLVHINSLLEALTVVFSEGLFALRTYVLWNRNKVVLKILISFYIIFLTAIGVILRFAGTTLSLLKSSFPNISACIISGFPRFVYGLYLVVLISELIILTMMIVRIARSGSRSALLKVMVRDGVLYCLCGAFLSTVSMVVWMRAPDGFYIGFVLYQSIFHTILASRLQLQLVTKSKENKTYATDTTSSTGPGERGEMIHNYELRHVAPEVA